MIKESFQQEKIIPRNIFAFSTGVPKCVNENIGRCKGKRRFSTIKKEGVSRIPL